MAQIILFTVVVALASVYGLLSKSNKIKFNASLGGLPLFLIISGFMLLILPPVLQEWMIYNQTNSIDFLTVSINRFWMGVIPVVSAISTFSIFALLMFRNSPRIRRDSYLSSKLRELNHEEEYGILADLIHNYYDRLVTHPEKPQKPVFVNFNIEFITALDESENQEFEMNRKQETQVKYSRFKSNLRYYYSAFKYKISNTSEESASYTETLLLSEDFGSEHPIVKPELGIKIIDDESLNNFFREKFVDRFLSSLLQSENSVLYRELYENKDIGLLRTLFDDIKSKRDLSLTSPVGDTVRDRLKQQRKASHDDYNDHVGFDKRGSKGHREPVQCGIRFIDSLVKNAFKQEISFVWLSHYTPFTRIICENYEITEHSDASAEHPNYYSSLLYEMVDNMLTWISLVDNVDNSEADYVRITERRDGINIPQESVRVLFNCHSEILTTDEIPYKFKKYLTEMIFRKLTKLRQAGEESIEREYSDLMLSTMEDKMEENHYYTTKMEELYHEVETVNNRGLRLGIISRYDRNVTGLLDQTDDIFDYEQTD